MSMSQMEKSYYSALIREVSELLKAKPWLTLDPTDVFAVRTPASEELLFVQINGGVDSAPQVMAYCGARGLEMLWELNNCENPAYVADMSVDVPALFFTFVAEEELDGRDREALEDAEGDFSQFGYPVFRSCRPGFQPCHITEQEVAAMLQVVRQTCEVVREVNEGTLDFNVEDGNEDVYILREGKETDDGVVWENSRIDMNLDEKLPKKAPKLKRADLALLKDLPQSEKELRVDLMVSPFVSGDETAETPSTFLFLVSDYVIGDVICARIEEPGAKLSKFRESLLGTFSEVIQHLGSRPKAVHLESYSVCDALGEALEKLEIAMRHHELPPMRPAENDAILRHLSTRYTRVPGKILF